MIFLLSFVVVYVLYSVTVDLMAGSRLPRGHINKYYNHLRGIRAERKPLGAKVLRLNMDQIKYTLDTRKYLAYALPACIGLFLFIMFFFRSFTFAAIISLIGLLYPRFIIINLIAKRKHLLNVQLKDALFALNSSLLAGASLANAIERCLVDLEKIHYNDKDAPIVLEFRRMTEDLSMGYTLEEALINFKNRVHLEDVDDFVNATLIAKERGGNITEVFGKISRMITEKIEISNEIKVMTAGKRMEAKILSFLPIGLVGGLTLLSPEYMEPMYSSIVGRILMFVGFVLIAINYFVSRKIIRIDI